MISAFFVLCFMFYASNVTHNVLSVDWAVFNYGIPKAEVYYSCPYNIFHYKVKNDTIYTRYSILYRLKNLKGQDSLVETRERKVIIPSFEIAQRRDMKLVDEFDFLAPQSGSYLLNLTLIESLPISSIIDTIDIPDFSRLPVLSNIELASLVKIDSVGGKFTKGKMRIIPNPDLNFGGAYELVYVYYEGYNLSQDTFSYELSYRILSENKSVIKSFPEEIKKKSDLYFANTFAFSTKGLMPGKYSLKLKLTDYGSGNQDSIEKYFWIIKKDTAQLAMRNSQLSVGGNLNYQQEIRFLATPSELNQYKSLSEIGKNEFLRKFWQKHNLQEFINRVKFVDSKYGLGRILGRDADRGRIYIKYGPPDEVVAHTMIEHTKPHEHWYYYSRGFHFIFIDIRGNNNFQLIYSNCDNEPKNPNWENYVDPLELEDLQ